MTVEYSVVAEYPGHDSEYDRRIKKAARREIGGSGFGLIDGTRDLSFYFKTEKAAEAAATRIRAMRPRKKGTRVKVYTNEW